MHNDHTPSCSAGPNPLRLGVQSTSTAETMAPAAALANKDFIQSLAMYSLYLGQLAAEQHDSSQLSSMIIPC